MNGSRKEGQGKWRSFCVSGLRSGGASGLTLVLWAAVACTNIAICLGRVNMLFFSSMLVPLITEHPSGQGPTRLYTPNFCSVRGLPHLAATGQSWGHCPFCALCLLTGSCRNCQRHTQKAAWNWEEVPVSPFVSTDSTLLLNSYWYQTGCQAQKGVALSLCVHVPLSFRGCAVSCPRNPRPFFSPFGWGCQGGPAGKTFSNQGTTDWGVSALHLKAPPSLKQIRVETPPYLTLELGVVPSFPTGQRTNVPPKTMPEG